MMFKPDVVIAASHIPLKTMGEVLFSHAGMKFPESVPGEEPRSRHLAAPRRKPRTDEFRRRHR